MCKISLFTSNKGSTIIIFFNGKLGKKLFSFNAWTIRVAAVDEAQIDIFSYPIFVNLRYSSFIDSNQLFHVLDAKSFKFVWLPKKIFDTKDIKIVNNSSNQGKGYCVSRGIKIATGDYIIIQDADLEYNPKDFKKMIKLITNKNNVVYGSRFITYKYRNSRYFINKGLTFISNLLFNQKLTDAHTCYRILESKLFKELKIREKK